MNVKYNTGAKISGQV